MRKRKSHKRSHKTVELENYIDWHVTIDSLLMYDADVLDCWTGLDARDNTIEAIKILIKRKTLS
jgi:hypothetical protein